MARGTVVPWLGNEYAQMQVVRFYSGNKYFQVQRLILVYLYDIGNIVDTRIGYQASFSY